MQNEMKIHEYENREEYIDIQVKRSQQKAGYCKVYFRDVFRYRDFLAWNKFSAAGDKKLWVPQKILCLGVRNGAELDIFRSVFFGPLMRLSLVRKLIISKDISSLGESKSRLAKLGGVGDGKAFDGRVVGVELNPNISREDVWIGSFDEMPGEWESEFDLIYSNSFDHVQDPEKTIAEWKRVAAPGAYIIICFTPRTEISDHDPLGGLDFTEIKGLWDLDLVFFSEVANENRYYEVCFRAGTKKGKSAGSTKTR